MRYIARAMITAALLLGVVALVTQEVDAQNQPDPSAAMRCDPMRHPSCPDDSDGHDSGGLGDVPEKETIVVYDRGQRQRPGEKHSRYEDRRYFVEHFERFVKQSKASDEQAQRILLALYDYQEQESALLKSMVEKAKATYYEGSLCPDPDDGFRKLSREYFRTLQSRLRAVLTQGQMDVWEQTCLTCETRVGWYHDDHISKLEER